MQTLQTANQTLFLESYFEIPVTKLKLGAAPSIPSKAKNLISNLHCCIMCKNQQKKKKCQSCVVKKLQSSSSARIWSSSFFSFFTIESSIYYTSSAACRKACIHLAASSALLVPNCVTCIYHQWVCYQYQSLLLLNIPWQWCHIEMKMGSDLEFHYKKESW
jgi:hypothetical protein